MSLMGSKLAFSRGIASPIADIVAPRPVLDAAPRSGSRFAAPGQRRTQHLAATPTARCNRPTAQARRASRPRTRDDRKLFPRPVPMRGRAPTF